MKKLILIYLLLSILNYAQISSNIQKDFAPVPTSAEAYALSKVGKLSVDYFNGTANINIPIYTISTGGIKLPIGISYNTGGVKLNEVASSTGLGWSLSIPGTVQQRVLDKSDLASTLYTRDLNRLWEISGYIDYTTAYDQIRNDILALNQDYYDTKPDLFEYNLPTLSGAFILKSNKEGLNVPYNNSKIKILANGSIHIIDDKGVNYWLGIKNNINSNIPGQVISNSSKLYRLDSLTYNSRKVSFLYEKMNTYSERNIIEKVNIQHPKEYIGILDGEITLPKYERREATTIYADMLISKIIFDEGEVLFRYSDEIPFQDGQNFRKDLNSNGGLALRKITVKDKNQKIIKDHLLNYSYFESTRSAKTYEDYRLKLNSIQNTLDKTFHNFWYHDEFSIPKRNASSDDYWGYINNLSNGEGTNIASGYRQELPVNFPSEVPTRDREPISYLTILGSLKTIQYPTGGKKNIYYELPKTNKRISLGQYPHYKTIASYSSSSDNPPFNGEQKVIPFEITLQDRLDIAQEGGNNLRMRIVFDNGSCYAMPGVQDELPNPDDPTSPDRFNLCTGGFTLENGMNGGSSRFTQYDFNGLHNGQLSIKRLGDCQCNIGVSIVYDKTIYEQSELNYSGLRIKRIEDLDEIGVVSNVFEYDYGKWENNSFIPISFLKQPIKYSQLLKIPTRKMVDGVESFYPIAERPMQKLTVVSSNSQSSNSYGSSQIATFPYVIEKTEKGRVEHEFNDIFTAHTYDKWKFGNILSQTVFNKQDDTLQVTKYEYEINLLKNSLTDFSNLSSDAVGFAADFTIVKSKKQINVNVDADIYDVEINTDEVHSGYLKNKSSITTQYLNGKKLITKTKNYYSDSNINLPFNFSKTVTEYEMGNMIEQIYQYAYEKGNQKLINANMIGIPLETSLVKRQNSSDPGKTISRTETKYDNPSNLFPTSVMSHNLQNAASTELTYDQYDSNGNLLQYTTKEGVVTSIIWGYHSTQPIAKITGVSFSVANALAVEIIAATDADVDAITEQTLIDKLDIFRKQSAFQNAQISTYTYNPLIGVTSITPPSGIREIYKYDSANRLESIKDINGRLIKEFKYNYKN